MPVEFSGAPVLTVIAAVLWPLIMQPKSLNMLQCNIGQRGRVVRFFGGALLVFVSSILFVIGVPAPTLGWRLFSGFFLFLGVFMIYEGAIGWCPLQALLNKKRR